MPDHTSRSFGIDFCSIGEDISLVLKSQSSARFIDCLVSFLSEKPSITYLNFGYFFLLLVLVLNCAQDVSYHVCLCSYLFKYVGQIVKG
jgi:hypothetical protein